MFQNKKILLAQKDVIARKKSLYLQLASWDRESLDIPYFHYVILMQTLISVNAYENLVKHIKYLSDSKLFLTF